MDLAAAVVSIAVDHEEPPQFPLKDFEKCPDTF
jgi:hypothetical protein